MLRKTLTAGVACLALLAMTSPALAGMRGVAIVDIEYAPDEFVGGETHEVLYSVLWMGSTPATGPSSLEFTPARETGDPNTAIVFEATPTETAGQYFVEVTLPSDGMWSWTARHSYGITDLGSIDVVPPGLATVLHHDVLALALALVLGAALARLVSRTEAEFGARILDHLPEVRLERARWDDQIRRIPG